MTRPKTSRMLTVGPERLLVFAIGLVFVYSGLIHASHPYLFLHNIASYRLVPSIVATGIAAFLPYLQILTGLSLIDGRLEGAGLKIAFAMSAVFVLAQTSAIIKGLPIDCGCFGLQHQNVSYMTLLVPFSIMTVTGIRLFRSREFASKPEDGF